VLQVVDSLRAGGAEVLLESMFSALTQRGIECEFYVLHSEDAPLERSLIAKGARLHAPLRLSVYSPLHIQALARHLKEHRYDIVHVHLFPAQLWAAVAARVARTPARLLTTEHSTNNRRRRGAYWLIDAWMYRQYVSIACISNAVAEALARWLPEEEGKLRVCPNGVDTLAFEGSARTNKTEMFPTADGSSIVLSVGRMRYEKGHDITIRALSLVEDAELVLVGTGAETEALRSLAREIGVGDRVHFLGRREDVPRLMKAADVLVQASRWEGFGIAALEALASGLPVVASRVPGLGDLVGDAGLLFEAGDYLQLAEQLNRLLGDQCLRASLGAAGRIRAREFDIQKTVDCYVALYEENCK